MSRHLPNVCTLLNLTSGSMGMLCVLQGHLVQAAWCIWLGGICDFLDGMLARWLKATSPLGKQLDALADLTTFGLLPTLILYTLLRPCTHSAYVPLVVLLLPVTTAWRLARFNTTTQRQGSFRGLPSTASGLFVSTLPLIHTAHEYATLTEWLTLPWVLVTIVVALSGLLVAPIALMTLKFEDYTWAANRGRYCWLAGSVILVALAGIEGILWSFLLYIGISCVTACRQ